MLEGTMADSDMVAAAMKRNGVVKSAHKGLTDDVIWHMDVLVFASRTQTLLYENRTTKVKTFEDGFEESIRNAAQPWPPEVSDMIFAMYHDTEAGYKSRWVGGHVI